MQLVCARVMGFYWKERDMMLASDQTSPSRRKARRLCGAKTRAGGSCQVRAEPGKTRCRFHDGKSTVRTHRRVVHVSLRPSVNADASIGREFGLTAQLWRKRQLTHSSLHRNATEKDAATRP